MFLSYLQLYIYLLNDVESKIIEDAKLYSISKIISMVSINNILLLKSSDTLSLIVFFSSLIFMVIYFVYVAIIAILRHYAAMFYEG